MATTKGRISINGYAIRRASGRLAPYRFTHGALGARGLLIDILYCGVCHSDIHEGRNEYGDAMYPMVPGHEIVGRVRAVGTGVSRFRPGAVVGVGPYIACDRTCDRCKRG